MVIIHPKVWLAKAAAPQEKKPRITKELRSKLKERYVRIEIGINTVFQFLCYMALSDLGSVNGNRLALPARERVG